MEIVGLSIGLPKEVDYNGLMVNTGIQKRNVKNAFLSKEGFHNDGVANTDFHGGPDRAVCFYVYEHYSKWEDEFKQPFAPPAFGENLTVRQMEESEICIGDILEIGDTIIQITQPRIPCSTISWENQNHLLLKRVVQTCFTGYFGRVLKEGEISKDAAIKYLEKDPRRVSVYKTIHTYMHNSRDKEAIEEILKVEALAEAMRKEIEKKLARLE